MIQQKYLHIRSLVMILCFFGLFLTAASAAGQNGISMPGRSAEGFSSVVKKAGPAVVYISVEKNSRTGIGRSGQLEDMLKDPFFERFFGRQFERRFRQDFRREEPIGGSGSGFIISPDGLILTNNHVVEDATNIKIRLADKREFTAKIIGTDPQSDVALIKIEGRNLPTLPLGNSDALEVGEWVIAIGNPFELSQSVTVGVVSAKGRSKMGITDYDNFIQTDAAINMGNSGGPLLNIHSQVIGINTAIFSRTGGSIGISFAIPINMAKSVEQQLRSRGKVVRGWLGLAIQDINKELARSFDLDKAEGILVSEVTPDSPADKAGLRPGDILLSINDIKLVDVDDLRNRVAMTPPGTSVSLQIVRDGRRERKTVLIAEQPLSFSKTTRMKMNRENSSVMKKMGLTLQELTSDLADQFGYSGRKGVVIAQVDPGTPAASIGLQAGQLIEEVNKLRVQNLVDVKKAVKKGKNPNQVLLLVRVGEYSRYVALSYYE